MSHYKTTHFLKLRLSPGRTGSEGTELPVTGCGQKGLGRQLCEVVLKERTDQKDYKIWPRAQTTGRVQSNSSMGAY